MPSETGDRRGRARLGVLVPFTNSNLEPDMALLAPPGMTVHVARMGGYDADEIPNETQMQDLGATDLDDPLALLSGVKPDVIMYGCTSATLTHGPAFDVSLAQKIKRLSGAASVTAAGSLVLALRFLGVARIGFASPYVAVINDLAVAFLDDQGIKTVARHDVPDVLDNDGQGALTPDHVFEMGQKADHLDAQAIVLSCTDMRSVETLQELEDTLGKPVISSNQALMFATLTALRMPEPVEGFGRLLRAPRL